MDEISSLGKKANLFGFEQVQCNAGNSFAIISNLGKGHNVV